MLALTIAMAKKRGRGLVTSGHTSDVRFEAIMQAGLGRRTVGHENVPLDHPHASHPHHRPLLTSRTALYPCALRPEGPRGREKRGEGLWVMRMDPWMVAFLRSSLHLMTIPMPPTLITGLHYPQGLLCTPAHRIRKGREAGIRGVRACGSW